MKTDCFEVLVSTQNEQESSTEEEQGSYFLNDTWNTSCFHSFDYDCEFSDQSLIIIQQKSDLTDKLNLHYPI